MQWFSNKDSQKSEVVPCQFLSLNLNWIRQEVELEWEEEKFTDL